ncbi:Tautomerase/MIF superfamily [Trichoderma sp. SZMC 28014]
MDQQQSPSPPPHKTPIVRITKPPHDTAATPERKLKAKTKIPSLETVIEGDLRAHPNLSPDDAARPVVGAVPRGEKERQAEKRSQYFHDALYERSGRNSAVEAVRREALVYAEIEDEQHFLITFSHQLAARYNRYPSSTVVSLLHSQCLFFGGSSHPAYILTITALPSEVQPATNKRNTAVLQKHMETILRVPPSRGMVRFLSITEECLAWGSKTVAGRISDAVAKDREVASEGEGSKSHERRILKSLSLRKSPASITPPSTQPPTPSRHGQEEGGNAAARKESTNQAEGEHIKVLKKKKSIIHTLFRTKAEDEEASVS